MGYAAAPRVAFIVYGIQTFFTAIIIIISENAKLYIPTLILEKSTLFNLIVKCSR